MVSAEPISSTTANDTSATTREALEAEAARPARVPSALRQVGPGLEARGSQRRRQAEDHAREQAEDERERQNGRVQPDVREPGTCDPVGHEAQQRTQAHIRQPYAECAGHGGDNEALREQLANEPRPAGAHRRADRHLAPAGAGPREEQVGHVRAADEQHAAGGPQQDQERRPAVAREILGGSNA